MNDLFADLLGSDSDPVPQPDVFHMYAQAGKPNLTMRRAGAPRVTTGVTINWMAEAFGISATHLRRKLQNCPVKNVVGNGTKLYDLHEAATYFIQPRNMAEHLAKMSAKELPTNLQREIWAARLAEQRWRQKAGELWNSEDCITIFSEVFKLIKSKSTLWIDSVNEVGTLTEEQEEVLRENVDQLLASIYQMVVQLQSGQVTPSQIAEAEEEDERTDDSEEVDLEEQDADG